MDKDSFSINLKYSKIKKVISENNFPNSEGKEQDGNECPSCGTRINIWGRYSRQKGCMKCGFITTDGMHDPDVMDAFARLYYKLANDSSKDDVYRFIDTYLM
jgi:hypothetical protein